MLAFVLSGTYNYITTIDEKKNEFHFKSLNSSTRPYGSFVIRKRRIHCDLKKLGSSEISRYISFNFTNGFFLLIFTIVMFIILLCTQLNQY
jgi:hypothetical protein